MPKFGFLKFEMQLESASSGAIRVEGMVPVRRAGLVAGVLVASLSTSALAAVPSAEEFYQSAMKLKRKGAIAIFSRGEIKRLVGEIKVAGEKVKETRLTAERTGGKGRYCPPKNSPRMGADEYLKGLSAIPATARRSIDLVEATTRILEKKFPCKG